MVIFPRLFQNGSAIVPGYKVKRYLKTIQITQDIKYTVKISYNPIIQPKPPLNFWYINFLNVRLSQSNVIEHLFYLIMPPVQILYRLSNFII